MKDARGRVIFSADELATICRRATGSFRNTIALELYSGMRLGDVLNLSPAMTALYSHANFDQKFDAMAVLPDTFAQPRVKHGRVRCRSSDDSASPVTN